MSGHRLLSLLKQYVQHYQTLYFRESLRPTPPSLMTRCLLMDTLTQRVPHVQVAEKEERECQRLREQSQEWLRLQKQAQVIIRFHSSWQNMLLLCLAGLHDLGHMTVPACVWQQRDTIPDANFENLVCWPSSLCCHLHCGQPVAGKLSLCHLTSDWGYFCILPVADDNTVMPQVAIGNSLMPRVRWYLLVL